MSSGTQAPKVSVIIPTYNREKYIGKAVESVLKQSYTDSEIIVIDDGSTDQTGLSLRRFGAEIRYYYQTNAGAGAARNEGIERSRGEWLAFLDSDDEWEADYLQKQMEKARGNLGMCMQTSNCRFVGRTGQTTSYFEINKSLPKFRGRDYLYFSRPFCFVVKHGPWQLGATIIRREAIIRAGLFDPRLKISEDYDLMARVALLGPFGMIRESMMNVYRRDEPLAGLTEKAKRVPVESRKAEAGIMESLLGIKTLRLRERRALRRVLSANRRAIGNLLFEIGASKEARAYYLKSVLIEPSIASIGKYLLSHGPQSVLRRMPGKRG
jgi:glycosyltransferase involved in cell wall biosynthesis